MSAPNKKAKQLHCTGTAGEMLRHETAQHVRNLYQLDDVNAGGKVALKMSNPPFLHAVYEGVNKALL